jgi:hypothetical protein
MREKKTDKRNQMVGKAIGVIYFPVPSDQMVTQFPLLRLSTQQQTETGMNIDYASNNPQIILLCLTLPVSNYTQKRLNNREGSMPSYVISEPHICYVR